MKLFITSLPRGLGTLQRGFLVVHCCAAMPEVDSSCSGKRTSIEQIFNYFCTNNLRVMQYFEARYTVPKRTFYVKESESIEI